MAVVERSDDELVELYMMRSGRRVLGSTSNTSIDGLRSLVDTLDSSLSVVPESSHVPLPSPGAYKHNGDVDEGILHVDARGIVEEAINSSLSSGASRAAGVLKLGLLNIRIRTSSGVSSEDVRSYALLNVRSFRDGDASGQGLTLSTTPRRLRPDIAGSTAGEYAERASKNCEIDEGRYNLILSPIVVADIIQYVGWASSAYTVSTGFSFLEGMLGRSIAPESLTIIDHGQIVDGVGSRMFDDEGVPTRSKSIVERGSLKTYLHNSSTAKEFGSSTTGNAGLIEPRAWNLEVSPGDSRLEEILREAGRGVMVTSNWYTRFQNFRTGEYSTLPRDAALVVEDGDVVCSTRGIRISSSIPHDLSSIRLISKERMWVKWWEVETPVLAPYILVEDVIITKPW